jgi:hypothetical protein
MMHGHEKSDPAIVAVNLFGCRWYECALALPAEPKCPRARRLSGYKRPLGAVIDTAEGDPSLPWRRKIAAGQTCFGKNGIAQSRY